MTADDKGRFTLALPAGPAEVTVSAAGHETLHKRTPVSAGPPTKTEYLLRPLPAYRRPFEATVRAGTPNEGQHVSLGNEELRTLPGGLGDPFRVIGLLAGVATPLLAGRVVDEITGGGVADTSPGHAVVTAARATPIPNNAKRRPIATSPNSSVPAR